MDWMSSSLITIILLENLKLNLINWLLSMVRHKIMIFYLNPNQLVKMKISVFLGHFKSYQFSFQTKLKILQCPRKNKPNSHRMQKTKKNSFMNRVLSFNKQRKVKGKWLKRWLVPIWLQCHKRLTRLLEDLGH